MFFSESKMRRFVYTFFEDVTQGGVRGVRGVKRGQFFFVWSVILNMSLTSFFSFAFEIAAPPVAPISFRTANVINQWLNYEWKQIDWYTGKFTLKFSLICSLSCRFCLVEFFVRFFIRFLSDFKNFHAHCFDFLISHFLCTCGICLRIFLKMCDGASRQTVRIFVDRLRARSSVRHI